MPSARHSAVGRSTRSVSRPASGTPAAVTNMTILRTELALAEAIAHRELGDRARALDRAPRAGRIAGRGDALLPDPGPPRAHPGLVGRGRPRCRAADRSSGGVADRGRIGRARRARAGSPARDTGGAGGWRAPHRPALGGPGRRSVLGPGLVARRRYSPSASGIEASAALELAEPRSARHEVVLALLRARGTATTRKPTKHAIDAVEVATANGMLQTVAAEGPEAIELIEHAAWRAPSSGWIGSAG